MLSWLSIQFVQTNVVLCVKYWVGAESQFGTLVLAVQASAFLFVLLWARASRRIGKQSTYYNQVPGGGPGSRIGGHHVGRESRRQAHDIVL